MPDEAEIALHALAGEVQCYSCEAWIERRQIQAVVPGEGIYCRKCYHKLFHDFVWLREVNHG